MNGFQLHPRLAADTVDLGRLSLARLLLMNDSQFPWLILVPERPDIREIHELDPADQLELMREISRVSARFQQHCGADKMNVAALGNQVPQLHVHVIARFSDDPAWPGPIWGRLPQKPYSEGEISRHIPLFRELFELNWESAD